MIFPFCILLNISCLYMNEKNKSKKVCGSFAEMKKRCTFATAFERERKLSETMLKKFKTSTYFLRL